jgi:hypothetical protein
MAPRPDPQSNPEPEARPGPELELSATEIVRQLRERNAPRRERVLLAIERLREIAEIKSRRRYWYW